jgi:hypothetical protein
MKTVQPLKDVDQLGRLIDEIGIARFEGRCASGAIDQVAGAKAMQAYVEKVSERPLASRLAHFLSDTVEVYKR